MTEEERSCLAAMPETFRVWRGTRHQESVSGMCWTTDPDRAAWFARRFQKPGQKAFVATGAVKKTDVYALFRDRKEWEIVSERVMIEDVKEI
jgi:hypothetical protein